MLFVSQHYVNKAVSQLFQSANILLLPRTTGIFQTDKINEKLLKDCEWKTMINYHSLSCINEEKIFEVIFFRGGRNFCRRHGLYEIDRMDNVNSEVPLCGGYTTKKYQIHTTTYQKISEAQKRRDVKKFETRCCCISVFSTSSFRFFFVCVCVSTFSLIMLCMYLKEHLKVLRRQLRENK